MTSVFLNAALLILAGMTVMAVVGLQAGDNSLVDIAYGPLFVLAGWGAWLAADGMSQLQSRPLLLLILVTVWGVRLGLHIGLRHRGRGEDFRYRRFREEWGETIIWRSLLQIYLLQGAVVLVIATPILLAIADPGGRLGLADGLGVLLFAAGFLFEAVSDWQMTVFKRQEENRGRLIQKGLWRYSRHPNYFGEALLWWGIFLIGLGAGNGWYGMVSPLTIAFLLLKVSGIPMLEAKYRDNPEFAAYKSRTSAFIPWFPRREGLVTSPHEKRRDNGSSE
jgi:steroid 5-alpha reductase family enzyme